MAEERRCQADIPAQRREHLQTIREKFGDGVRAIVPLFDQELRGTAMLDTAARTLFA